MENKAVLRCPFLPDLDKSSPIYSLLGRALSREEELVSGQQSCQRELT